MAWKRKANRWKREERRASPKQLMGAKFMCLVSTPFFASTLLSVWCGYVCITVDFLSLSVSVCQCACLCVLFVCLLLLFCFLASDVCFCVYTRACTLGPYFPAALRLSQTSLSLSVANCCNWGRHFAVFILNPSGWIMQSVFLLPECF